MELTEKFKNEATLIPQGLFRDVWKDCLVTTTLRRLRSVKQSELLLLCTAREHDVPLPVLDSWVPRAETEKS